MPGRLHWDNPDVSEAYAALASVVFQDDRARRNPAGTVILVGSRDVRDGVSAANTDGEHHAHDEAFGAAAETLMPCASGGVHEVEYRPKGSSFVPLAETLSDRGDILVVRRSRLASAMRARWDE